jgi:peroxiredoxin
LSSKPLVEAVEAAFQRARDMDAPLNDRLQVIADAVRVLSPSFAAAVDRLVSRLSQSGAGTAAPGPGERMPPFVLPDEAGHLVDLEDLLGKGPVAVAFHRGHWCPYCRLNTIALARVQQEAEMAGGQLVAITPDRQKFAALLKSEAKAPFPILTDMDNGYALSLNLAIWVGEEMEKLIAAAGCDVPAYQGNDAWMLPIPATFVVGTDGLIKARHIDPDYRRRMEAEDLLAALRTAH